MKVSLEVTGGFSGPAGQQIIELDLDQPSTAATDVRRDLGRLNDDDFGRSFLAPHPKPWDFRHVLKVSDAAGERAVTFHLEQGPPELTRIAKRLLATAH